MIRANNVRLELTQELTTELLSDKTGIKNIKSWHFYKKSIDARKKNDVHYLCSVDIEAENETEYVGKNNIISAVREKYKFPNAKPRDDRPIVVGSGPAGLFAALMLAENNHAPIVLERGECVEERIKSVERYRKSGILNENSNVQFGEGGAGTFSDGKLTTGIKNIRCKTVLERFVQFGAPEEILYTAKPHIGTDILRGTVKNMREYIISKGGEFRFNCRMRGLIVKNSAVAGVIANDEEIFAKRVILAIGHSARDTVETLFFEGVDMVAKPFSVGARIEHKQALINENQYGKFAPYLGAADYKLSAHLPGGRGVYTFCMCPGGEVIGAASAHNGVVTNGMSYSGRNGENANAALLVGINPKDFGEMPLAGAKFQEKTENAAFLCGGGGGFAPAQLVGDFLKNVPSVGAGEVKPTYRPGVKWGKIDECLPEFVCDAMREAIKIFDKKIHGFAAYDAVLTAPETRSSSPVRILRGEDYQSNIKGLYPCGEGAGYAGGIMSAAVDGIECAERLAENE